MHDLYVKWKARAFLLIDVPPMHRSPGGVDLGIDDERYTTWNEELVSQAREFADSASQASVFVASSYNIISDILDDPNAYGLRDSIRGSSDSDDDEEQQDEVSNSGASVVGRSEDMWEDDIHLSPAGHRAFANRLWDAL